MKPRIVISGVNLVDLGPLSIYRDALRTLAEMCGGQYEIVALVQRKELLDVPGVTYLEFPHIKGSWLRRVLFEYMECFEISKRLRPVAWIAMHDMTPRVWCERQFVYCHNPTPFYAFNLREAALEPKHGMFILFYRFLYGLFIQRNTAVIVQQEWIRTEFKKAYRVKHVIVARPNVPSVPLVSTSGRLIGGRLYRFFYPAFPRTFKNHELLLKAVGILEKRGIGGFEVFITVDAANNRCAADLYRRHSKLRSVRWLGNISRDRVYEIYEETDCLVFPSKLETWGLPLSEFKTTGKPILAVDLAYARETIGAYGQVGFFDLNDPGELADLMQSAVEGTLQWKPTQAVPISEPYAQDWRALWVLLFSNAGILSHSMEKP